MRLFDAIVLGIIEGLTEFLPVSSTGHLIVARQWLGVSNSPEAVAAQEIFLFVSQVGAIAAVVLVFWRRLWALVCSLRPANLLQHPLAKLFVAFVPTAIIGLLGGKLMEKMEQSTVLIACAFIVGGVLMEWIDRRWRHNRPQTLADVTFRQAFLIGTFQCLSMIPGTSRSAASILTGMVVGLNPSVAAEFSFFLAIPTLCGAGFYKLVKHRHELVASDAGVILVGTLIAFVVALLVVEWFIGFVRRRRFTPFVIYRVILGALVLATALWNRG